MKMVCLDLEGVLIPEMWVEFAEVVKIEDLKLTTREIPDYDVLMKKRLSLLNEHGYKLQDIQNAIEKISPLAGAKDFLDQLRSRYQVIILSDTFYEFASPLMKQLGNPSLFAHSLEVDSTGKVINYHLRLQDQKTKAVDAFQKLSFKVVAAGDSYNDTGMLLKAEKGFFFNPPEQILKDFPQIEVTRSYDDLIARIDQFFNYGVHCQL